MAVSTAELPLQILAAGEVILTDGFDELIPVISVLVFVIVPVADNVCVELFTELPVNLIQGNELYAPRTILPSVPVTSLAA